MRVDGLSKISATLRPASARDAEPVALQLDRAVEQAVELVARKLVAGEKVTRHPGIVVRAVTWNLFHGRDSPPNPALFTARSKFLRVTERDATHVQVNRPLRAEFERVLERSSGTSRCCRRRRRAGTARSGGELGAESAMTLTSRNQLRPLLGLAADLNPDLIGVVRGRIEPAARARALADRGGARVHDDATAGAAADAVGAA